MDNWKREREEKSRLSAILAYIAARQLMTDPHQKKKQVPLHSCRVIFFGFACRMQFARVFLSSESSKYMAVGKCRLDSECKKRWVHSCLLSAVAFSSSSSCSRKQLGRTGGPSLIKKFSLRSKSSCPNRHPFSEDRVRFRRISTCYKLHFFWGQMICGKQHNAWMLLTNSDMGVAFQLLSESNQLMLLYFNIKERWIALQDDGGLYHASAAAAA